MLKLVVDELVFFYDMRAAVWAYRRIAATPSFPPSPVDPTAAMARGANSSARRGGT